MIKFGEQIDACEKSNTDLSEKYKSIKPTENMSDSDLMALQNAVISAVEKKCNAQIRDK